MLIKRNVITTFCIILLDKNSHIITLIATILNFVYHFFVQ